MANDQYDSLTLVGRHVPDRSIEQNPDGTKYEVPLPGVYQVGVMFGDVFQPVATFKASDLELPGSGQSVGDEHPAGQGEQPQS